MEYLGESFLNKLYNDLHMSNEVMHTASKSDNKNEKISKYLSRLEKVEEMAVNSKYNGLNHLKNLYYRKYVIKPENVPDSYFQHQRQIALDRGFGHVEISASEKEEMIKSIIEDQKKSLEVWLDYLIKNDAKYPEWFKYYAFQGMLKLGSLDKEKGTFNKRTNTTTSIFVDLNREALALTYDNLTRVLEGNSIDDNILQKLIDGGSFAKIYGYLIKKLDSINKDNFNSNEGIWIKYLKGSKPDILVKSLEGRGTGWCTAGYDVAKRQLELGDFYVYYTKDKDDNYSVPRIAIRMDDNKIGEIRGVAKNQNMEPEMEEVLKEKLEEFPDRKEYLKKVYDMELLTKIYNEHNSRELTREEIAFLYEIDYKIDNFGYQEDPRISEIIDKRSVKKDLAFYYNCSEENISLDKNDVLNGKRLMFFYGALNLNELKNLEGIHLPRIVIGGLDLTGLESAEDLVLPEEVKFVDLSNLKSANGLVLPKKVEVLNLRCLEGPEGLVFPEEMKVLDLSYLESAKDIVLPKKVEELSLGNLISAEGLVLPEEMEYLDLRWLRSANGLVLPKKLKTLYLYGLKSAEGLVFPEEMECLELRDLESANGLVLPKKIECLSLDSLKSAEGLVFPEEMKVLDLSGLESAKGLVLPKKVKRLMLGNLRGAEGLVLPDEYIYVEYACPNDYEYGFSIDDIKEL